VAFKFHPFRLSHQNGIPHSSFQFQTFQITREHKISYQNNIPPSLPPFKTKETYPTQHALQNPQTTLSPNSNLLPQALPKKFQIPRSNFQSLPYISPSFPSFRLKP